MGQLLEVYDEMTKVAVEQELVPQRVEVIEKYASVAEDLLEDECGTGQYTEKDIVKVAIDLINRDIDTEEYDEAGRILARNIYTEGR